MNILFYTSFKISPTKGGTEHATLTVANALKTIYGCTCYAIHSIDAETENIDVFREQLFIPYRSVRKNIRNFIINRNIDVVLSEGDFLFTSYVRETCGDLTNLKNIFVHHFTPGWEENFLQFDSVCEEYKKSSGLKKIKPLIKLLLLPILKKNHLMKLPTQYGNVYKSADKVVLLSNQYIQPFQDYGRFSDKAKFEVIPNAISFPQIINREDCLFHKKNKILVVSRLEENQKRISLVLKVWEQIKKDNRATDWKLDILGEGPNEKQYVRYAQKHGLKDICFCGRQNPLNYYRESSIFMMTSRSEGFPLTLGEAMQNGCVPIAFNSFATLTDIINKGEDGIIIPECNIEMYVDQLLQLMTDKTKRDEMALNAIKNCQRFSQERIANRWWAVLDI